MQNDTLVLDQLRGAYKAVVEEWIAAIKQEEALRSRSMGAGALKGRRDSQQSESCEEAI
jgi:hypothetical protein